ncbi:MAG: hypothetical protein ACOX4D_07630 [Bacteroidales bacterium]|jgi:hypothetical protein
MKDITYDPTKGKWKTRDGWYFNTTKKARDHLKKSKKEVKETKTINNKPKNKDDGTK